MRFSLKGEDAHGDHSLGSWWKLGLSPTSDSPFISPSFSSGQRNRAYWASQLQKSVTLQPQPGRGVRPRSLRGHVVAMVGKKINKELYMFRADRLTDHHQEYLNTVYTAIGICHACSVGCLLARAGPDHASRQST